MRWWLLLLTVVLLQDRDKAETGPHKVRAIREIVLKDRHRDKELQVRVTWPDAEGPFPLILFSHGAFGTKDNYGPIVEFWAGHGYVVLQANHSDSRALGGRPGPTAFNDWQNRPEDISFMIDSLDTIVERHPELKGKIDGEKIGVGGHSYGANTAQLIGGARALVRGKLTSFRDRRVDAAMLLSGQGRGGILNGDSWKKFDRPMFVMSGTKDASNRTGKPASWRREPYELSPPGDKVLVWVEGLQHNFGGITGARSRNGGPNDDHVKYTRIATLAFWDAYLKADEKAKQYLRSDRLEKLSKDKVTVSTK